MRSRVRLTQREKEMADMFEQMSKDEQEIMIEFAKRLRTEDPKELVKEINQRLDILKMNGATCVTYKNGKELVDAFESVKPGEFNAVLMDVQMPVMNGLDATRAIRAGKNPLGRKIPIIAMTANAFVEDIRDCLEAGMDAHIAKPIDIDLLEIAMRAFYPPETSNK